MTRPARILGALMIALITVIPLGAGPAAAAGAPTTITASAARDAASAVREARLLRQETVAMLNRYLADYGDRVTAAENDQLRAYRTTADRQLATVVVTTRRLQSAVAAGAPRAQVLAAGRAAQRSHERARAAAQTSYEAARRIMEPQLSVFEGIGALRDYSAMMARFDGLRDRIDAVVATVD
jgi:hypothetical protein